jgi:CubicO group peptidase (beta-lactamase class C family)
MTANWQPPPGQAPGQPPVPHDAPPGYGYNWGLAYPVAGYQPVAWIPRPPRPTVVNLAVVLTLLGVLVSAVHLVVNLVFAYSHRDDLISQLSRGSQRTTPGLEAVHTAFGLSIVVAVVFWLLPAAGAVVTALLARRGANAARIVLASLMGVYALNDLCNGVFGLVNPAIGGMTQVRDSRVSPVFDLSLAALAIAIGVLVLVPPAHRFFSAGPGRRFMPST